jgi:hypothetical protein
MAFLVTNHKCDEGKTYARRWKVWKACNEQNCNRVTESHGLVDKNSLLPARDIRDSNHGRETGCT